MRTVRSWTVNLPLISALQRPSALCLFNAQYSSTTTSFKATDLPEITTGFSIPKISPKCSLITVPNLPVAQLQPAFKAVIDHDSRRQDSQALTKRHVSKASRWDHRAYGYSKSVGSRSLRWKKKGTRSLEQSSEAWRSELESIIASHQPLSIARGWKSEVPARNILHHIPNYSRIRSRLRRRVLRKVWFSCRRGVKQAFMQTAFTQCLKDCPTLAFDILRDLIHLKLDIPGLVIQNVVTEASVAVLSNSAKKVLHPYKTVSILRLKLNEVLQTLGSGTQHTMNLSIVTAIAQLLSRRSLKQLLQNFPPEMSKYLSVHSLCRLIQISTRKGLVTASVSLLQSLHNRQKRRDDFLIQWTCVSLVRIRLNVARSYLHSLRVHLVHEILRIGIVPSEALRNAIIQTFMEGGEADAAWKVFRQSVDQELLPTRGTFFALLQRFPSHKLSDIFQIARVAKFHGCLDATVVYRLLDAMQQIRWHDEPRITNPFQSALEIYAQVFDIQPLFDVGFVDRKTCSALKSADSPRLPPTAKTVTLMTRAFCQEFAGSLQIWTCYQKFAALVLSGHRLFTRMALEPWPFEYFMVGMSTHPDLAALCAQVLQDMLHQGKSGDQETTSNTTSTAVAAAAAAAAAETTTTTKTGIRTNTEGQSMAGDKHSESQSGDLPMKVEKDELGIQIAQPRSTTWNILLSSLVNARKIDAAEELVGMMQEEGFRPTLVTWNTLIDGFSKAQNPRKVAMAVEQMEYQRFVVDDRTRRALTRIVNRAALSAELRKARRRANTLNRNTQYPSPV